MRNKLTIMEIGDIFINRFGYPSRKAKFFDTSSELEKELYLHRGHAGYYYIWKELEKNGRNAIFYGEIRKIEINEGLIRSVRPYKEALINSYVPSGIIIFFYYHGLSERGIVQLALKNQLWQYINVKNAIFYPHELTENEFLI